MGKLIVHQKNKAFKKGLILAYRVWHNVCMWRDKLPKTETPQDAAHRRIGAYGLQRAIQITELQGRYTRGGERAREGKIMACLVDYTDREAAVVHADIVTPSEVPMAVVAALPMQLRPLLKKLKADDEN